MIDGDVLLDRLRALGRTVVLALPNVAVALALLLLFWLLARLLARLVRSVVTRAGQPKGVQIVLGRLTTWGTVGLGVLVGLVIVFPGVTPASVFGALGIGSVAIGFAFKDVLQNLLSGMLILLTRPFRIGDQIVTGSHEGTVEDIAVRATTLRTYDNRRVVIPNSELYTNRVTVNTAYPRRRLSVVVGIGYGDDIDVAKRVVLSTVATLPGVADDPAPTVLVTALSDFTVDLEVRFWISPPARREAVEVQDQVLSALKPALVGAGVDLPLPTQQVLLHDQTEDGDGDRARQREGWPPAPARTPTSDHAPDRKAPTP
ncbi:Mechanosensitive ion channel [Microlunatus sagamiharensis]|uniref:Mechanosensitive ion channel n=1 Tax=Microlunatus sagamiharensis TaxID=546874 RepID=A0A1H2LR46_9ACTN|nr:mechanosensitive ion channel family protein [Microlunatus sagamiharensis]SDU83312.1 Mechanosensitive ion channel [Microlunatus sagamiharensis]